MLACRVAGGSQRKWSLCKLSHSQLQSLLDNAMSHIHISLLLASVLCFVHSAVGISSVAADEPIKNVGKRVTAMLRHRLGRKKKEICYELLGCFPVEGALKKGPQDPREVDTRFYLYSREKESEAISYADGRSSLVTSSFRAHRPTRFLVHGFKGSARDKGAKAIVHNLLALEECNVILLDWEKGASGPSYRLSAANTQLVGRQLELLLMDIISMGAAPSTIHLIGFSLGAHIAGYAGRSLVQRGIKLARITGLDPASPLFREHFSTTLFPALSKEDAALVDVIHTDGSILWTEGFGLRKALGHVDFFPNGGQDQPGCNYVFASVLVSHFEGTVNSSTVCNHIRGFHLFLESISGDGCQFRAYSCISREHFRSGACFPGHCRANNTDASCGVMGYNANKVLGRGPMYLVTRDQPPYCGDQLQSTVVLAKRGIFGRGLLWLTLRHNNETTTFSLHQEPELSPGSLYRGLAAAKYGSMTGHTLSVMATVNFRPSSSRRIEDPSALAFLRVANLDGQQWSYCGKELVFHQKEDFESVTVELRYNDC